LENERKKICQTQLPDCQSKKKKSDFFHKRKKISREQRETISFLYSQTLKEQQPLLFRARLATTTARPFTPRAEKEVFTLWLFSKKPFFIVSKSPEKSLASFLRINSKRIAQLE